MKIQIASDLHLEFLEQQFPDYVVVEPTDADVLIIAGDIHVNSRAVVAFADWPVPVIYVHGNHEAYHAQYTDVVPDLRRAAEGTQVRILEQEELVMGNVRFLGCCLWTDYGLVSDSALAMSEAESCLNDHRMIHMGDRLFSAADALQLHGESRAWLKKKLAEDFDGSTVVITHHGPHPNSIHRRFTGTPLNAAFVSDLTPLMGKAELWIHGHVHNSFDYEVNGTRVVVNPRGYPLNRAAVSSIAQIDWENREFNPQLVVEVGGRPRN